MNKRYLKVLALVLLDMASLYLSFLLAYIVKFDQLSAIPPDLTLNLYVIIGVMAGIKWLALLSMRMYNKLWRFAGITELLDVIFACGVGTALVTAMLFFISRQPELSYILIPRSILLLSFIFDVILIGGSRFAYRLMFHISPKDVIHSHQQKRVLVYGAGQAGVMVLKEIKSRQNTGETVIGFMDDDPGKKGQKMHGLPVFGGKDKLMATLAKQNVDMLVIAIPSASETVRKELIHMVKDTKIKISILPKVYDLIEGTTSVQAIRPVEIEDLLGRDEVKLDNETISAYITNKVVLVTGGGGSIGSELCRQIVRFSPKELIIVDIYENNAYDIQMELKREVPNQRVSVLIASVRDENRIRSIFEDYRPQVVFHAAAHKHVPLMEDSPCEAIKNNVFGTYHVAEAASTYGAERFVLISTDKAVNPTNVMGASKRLCEMIVQSFSQDNNKTDYMAVRFGNVLGSNGSVIPLFKEQIKKGGPVTVTHPDIIRYFMTIPEAAQLVIQAGGMARGGELFVLDMGDPVKIDMLARDLIRLSGFEPDMDIKIEYTGLRPGEKLYEELLMSEEGLTTTSNDKIFIAKPMTWSMKELKKQLKRLDNVISSEDGPALIALLYEIVPTFKNPEEVNTIHLEKDKV